ncbi:hypothetical protein EGH21_02455 [Halomicroarcula sp. F13]|uniref:Small CPxCG-related zinc finger protein n=1 Tax=Haloarcula rubra TaxID=2487747 RepID=A0AAW4PM96_9EURY|nr:hypothetical protein [Halomicroarcula rubra]MBX0321886.1 hypothetical protein [Halomicroarcula rubra]
MTGPTCPACETELVAFTDLPADVRERLEADEHRQRQSVAHRREKHTVCPSCTLEIHGCGQPYAIPDAARPDTP